MWETVPQSLCLLRDTRHKEAKMCIIVRYVWDLEKEMATHSSILAWKIPWTGEPGGLQSMGSQKSGTGLTD